MIHLPAGVYQDMGPQSSVSQARPSEVSGPSGGESPALFGGKAGQSHGQWWREDKCEIVHGLCDILSECVQ